MDKAKSVHYVEDGYLASIEVLIYFLPFLDFMPALQVGRQVAVL